MPVYENTPNDMGGRGHTKKRTEGGRLEGVAKGERAILLKLLTLKFGPLAGTLSGELHPVRRAFGEPTTSGNARPFVVTSAANNVECESFSNSVQSSATTMLG